MTTLIKMMTTKNFIREGAEDAFRAKVAVIKTDEQDGTYRWQKMNGGRFRARCIEHGLMTWEMAMDPRYGVTQNKHTERNGEHVVDYLGRPVQVWVCRPCKQADAPHLVIK